MILRLLLFQVFCFLAKRWIMPTECGVPCQKLSGNLSFSVCYHTHPISSIPHVIGHEAFPYPHQSCVRFPSLVIQSTVAKCVSRSSKFNYNQLTQNDTKLLQTIIYGIHRTRTYTELEFATILTRSVSVRTIRVVLNCT